MHPASTLPLDHAERMQRARLSLDGLSIGDSFGQRFFYPFMEKYLVEGERPFPQPPWPYTDDTEMALAIVQTLEKHGRIDQSHLAQEFARRYWRNPSRGYGATAHQILQAIAAGQTWNRASAEAFDGQGSMGNGGAMRVAPLGAYFAEDWSAVIDEAKASAEVTHGHPEGQAGAIAIAIAAAYAWRIGKGEEVHSPGRLILRAMENTPRGETHQGIEKALHLPLDASPVTAARILGSGLRVTSPDTVPFALWCADRHLDNFEEALWTTVSGLGDRDTTCAIVGGIVALAVGTDGIPVEWLKARETLHFLETP